MPRAIRSGATRLAEASHEFVLFYLLVHGVLKLGIVVALLWRGGRLVFPIAALILAAFVAYMSRLCSLEFTATQYALLSSLARNRKLRAQGIEPSQVSA